MAVVRDCMEFILMRLKKSSSVKQLNDRRQVVVTVTQNRVKTATITWWTHSRPCWRRILDPGNNSGTDYCRATMSPECRARAGLIAYSRLEHDDSSIWSRGRRSSSCHAQWRQRFVD